MQRHIEIPSRSARRFKMTVDFPSGDYARGYFAIPQRIYGQSAKLYRDHQLRTEGSKECRVRDSEDAENRNYEEGGGMQ